MQNIKKWKTLFVAQSAEIEMLKKLNCQLLDMMLMETHHAKQKYMTHLVIKMTNTHLHCGGELKLQKEGSMREYDTYFCDKCRNVVRVFTAPSYDEYVAEGYLKKPAVYFFIANTNKFCSRCGTINKMGEVKCRGCGGVLTVNIPKPRTITDTGRFGL
jgi:hypothetical protein